MSAVAVADPAETLAITRSFAYATITLASVILLSYLAAYVRHVLAEPYRHRWWYLGIGIAAGVVYGASGLVAVTTGLAWPAVFADGATLFFILFLALGIRAMYSFGQGTQPDSPFLSAWLDYAVIAGFVLAWWVGFLFQRENWIVAVETVGWVGATAWALAYGVLTVRKHEGTSIAALTRHLLPAVVTFAVIVVVEIAGQLTGSYGSVVDATWIVGTVLGGAFLFNTAVAIRQQGGEVERMYDWTTWRG